MDNTNRFDREIAYNPDNLKRIANAVNARLQFRLDMMQLRDLLSFVRSHNHTDWSRYDTQQICNVLAQNFISSRFTDKGRANREQALIDMHEVLKAGIGTSDAEPVEHIRVDANGNPVTDAGDPTEAAAEDGSLGAISKIGTVDTVQQVASVLNVMSLFGRSDDISLQQLFNPRAALRKNYILLDSRWRDTSGDTPGQGLSQMSWTFLANTANTAAGGVNSVGDVQQVVAFQTGDIRLPYQGNALVNAYRRISMLVNEWSGQAHIGQEGRKFHLLFKSELDANMLNCRALPSGLAKYEFAKPITQLDTITLTFGCPLEPIVFDMDRQSMTVQYTNPPTLTCVYPHRLQTGDQVYISGFNTADPATDAFVIAQINNASGWNVLVTDAYTFQLGSGVNSQPPPDLSAVVNPIAPLTVQVYFGSKRVFVPLELTYIPSTQQN